MENLRTIHTARVAHNGILYTIIAQTPFVNGIKSFPEKETFTRQFKDIAESHAKHVEYLKIKSLAQFEVDEFCDTVELVYQS